MIYREECNSWWGKLNEYLVQDIENNVSNITRKALDKRRNEGDTGVRVVSAHLQYPDMLEIGFEVESSYGDNNQVSTQGQWIGGHQSNYLCYFQFVDVDKALTPDFTNKTRNIQIQQLQQCIDQCDVQVTCNCPAYHWQGSKEDNAKAGIGIIDPYKGKKGKGIWRTRHMPGTSNVDIRACKHLVQIAEDMGLSLIKEIAQKISPRTPNQQQPEYNIKPASKKKANAANEVMDNVTSTGKPKEVKKEIEKEMAKKDDTKIDAAPKTATETKTKGDADVTQPRENDPDRTLTPDTNELNVDPQDAIKVLENQEDDLKDQPLEDNYTEFQDN